jgi:hypothetical protein
VFVDDLDRCEVPKAAELLQALNLMLARDLPFIVVLAMDRAKIAAGIASRHRELLRFLPPAGPENHEPPPWIDDERSAGLAYGYDFVEKFVQLPLRVPRLTSEGLQRFLDGLLNAATEPSAGRTISVDSGEDVDLVDRDGGQVRRVMEMVSPALGFNPRRMKQFLNLFRLRHYVAMSTGQLTMNAGLAWTLPQIGKVVAVELRWPLILDRLLETPKRLSELCTAARERESSEPFIRSWIADSALCDLILYKWNNANPADYDLSGVSMPHLLGMLYGTGSLAQPPDGVKSNARSS